MLPGRADGVCPLLVLARSQNVARRSLSGGAGQDALTEAATARRAYQQRRTHVRTRAERRARGNVTGRQGSRERRERRPCSRIDIPSTCNEWGAPRAAARGGRRADVYARRKQALAAGAIATYQAPAKFPAKCRSFRPSRRPLGRSVSAIHASTIACSRSAATSRLLVRVA